jgi:hypothetical protein
MSDYTEALRLQKALTDAVSASGARNARIFDSAEGYVAPLSPSELAGASQTLHNALTTSQAAAAAGSGAHLTRALRTSGSQEALTEASKSIARTLAGHNALKDASRAAGGGRALESAAKALARHNALTGKATSTRGIPTVPSNMTYVLPEGSSGRR